jgi:hypothetical protein
MFRNFYSKEKNSKNTFRNFYLKAKMEFGKQLKIKDWDHN